MNEDAKKSIEDARKMVAKLEKKLADYKKEHFKAQAPKAQAVRPIIRKGSQRGR